MKRILLVYNPISGKGQSAFLARSLREALSPKAKVTLVESKPAYTSSELEHLVVEQDLVIVVGGDGTLVPFLEVCAVRNVALTMYPAGNESLFAREFHIPSDPSAFVNAVEKGRYELTYYGRVNGAPFFHMVSVGFDSMIIQTLQKGRAGPAGNIGYVLPILKTLLRYRGPRITIRVDGAQVVSSEIGYCIVGNTSQYAGSLAPVVGADSRQSQLAVRFYPWPSILRFLPWGWNFIRKSAVKVGDSRLFEGESVEVLVEPGDFPIQADGEFIGTGSFTASKSQAQIRVLRFVE